MNTTIAEKDALSIIDERKSVRNFNGQPVHKDDILKLLKAAMAAPAAIHMCPWKFVVITDKYKLAQLEKGLPFAKMLVNAGTAIVVCANPKDAALGSEEFAILDCACASENLLLAAEALGLGAVWTAVYPNPSLVHFVQHELGIPEHVIPLNVIPVGHPTGEDKPQQKFDARNIHWEAW